MPNCGGLEVFLLYVEQRAEVLTHTLAVCDADRFLFEPVPFVFPVRRRGASGNSAIRSIDDHPEYRAACLSAQLDIEYFEPVAPRHALRGRTDAFELLT
jgi:hypothetical protein